MKFQTIKKMIAVIISIVISVCLLIAFKYFTPKDCISTERIVRHGSGLIEGNTVSNSYEALQDSYQKGYRFIEVDLCLTNDDQLVCSHGFTENDSIRTGNEWENGIPDMEEFMQTRIYGKYTPMTICDLVVWMKKHRDTDIYLDIKNMDYYKSKTVVKRIKAAVGRRKSLYDRMLISARNIDMLKAFSEAGCFRFLHFWYAPPEERDKAIQTTDDFIRICNKYDVKSWSIGTKYIGNEDITELLGSDMRSCIYNIKSDYELSLYEKMGFDYFISDNLEHDRLNKIEGEKIFVTDSKVNGDKCISIRWSEYGSNSRYEIRRTETGGEWEMLSETNSCEYKDDKIEPDVLYGYQIKELNSGETSPIYWIATLPKPGNVTVLSDGINVTVSWEGNEHADGYTVYRESKEAGQDIKVIWNSNETQFVEKNPGNDKSYRVRAFKVINDIRYYSGYTKPCKIREVTN